MRRQGESGREAMRGEQVIDGGCIVRGESEAKRGEWRWERERGRSRRRRGGGGVGGGEM